MTEATTQLLIRLPDSLARRFKRRVPVRQRSKFVERLLEQAFPPDEIADDDPLYQAALAVERDEQLAAEMAEWEQATASDGLDAHWIWENRTNEHSRWGTLFGPSRRCLVGRARSDAGKRNPQDQAGRDHHRRRAEPSERTIVVVPLSTGPEPRPPIVVATPSAGPRVSPQRWREDERGLTCPLCVSAVRKMAGFALLNPPYGHRANAVSLRKGGDQAG